MMIVGLRMKWRKNNPPQIFNNQVVGVGGEVAGAEGGEGEGVGQMVGLTWIRIWI